MEIDITGRHFQVTEPLKQYAGEKIQKLDKFSLKLESVHIVMEVQKFHHIVEITVLGKNLRFTAKEQSTDMYATFDKALGNIQFQLGRQHDKLRDHKGKRVEAGEQGVSETDENEGISN